MKGKEAIVHLANVNLSLFLHPVQNSLLNPVTMKSKILFTTYLIFDLDKTRIYPEYPEYILKMSSGPKTLHIMILKHFAQQKYNFKKCIIIFYQQKEENQSP